MRAAMRWLGAAACVAVALPVWADIVVMKNRQYYEGKVTAVTNEVVKLETEYGTQELARASVADYFQPVIGKQGKEYYDAGVALLQLGDSAKAQELFDKAAKLDPAYADAGSQAMARAAGSGTAAGPPVTVVRPPQPQVQPLQLACTICGGSGRVTRTSKFAVGGGEGGRTYEVSCPVCAGRGVRILQVRPGYGVCPTCAGMGTSGGSSSSSYGGGDGTKTMIASQYPPCRRCGGTGMMLLSRGGQIPGATTQPGVIGQPGTGTVGSSMPSMTPPPPGAIPQTGSQPSSSGEETSASEEGEEGEEGSGSSDTSEEEQSWFMRNLRWVLILGGVGLLGLVFAVSKMGRKQESR